MTAATAGRRIVSRGWPGKRLLRHPPHRRRLTQQGQERAADSPPRRCAAHAGDNLAQPTEALAISRLAPVSVASAIHFAAPYCSFAALWSERNSAPISLHPASALRQSRAQ